ncbi:uncharacterized protein LOC141873609 isoform X1 [Acropora palmata]|uniref:uncharacterized protein LOC141873609 isoform X1 n=1 Tax=Acropora palmata TaxID=6131 RepID=UPI003D9FCA0D
MSSGMADNSTKPNKQSRRKQGTERRGKTAGSNKEKIDEQRRLKELEASMRSQVAAEERAHKIVEKRVLEDNISSDFLVQAMQSNLDVLALNSILKPLFENKWITVWQLAFRARKVLGTFEKQGPGFVMNETVTGLRKSYTYFTHTQ